MTKTHYAVAIFVSRESSERAMKTIHGALTSALPGTVIDVLVNGNPELARSLQSPCRDIPIPKEKRLRLWNMELGDKANAWNQFVQCIFEGQEIVWFMDGYVTPNADAFLSLRSGLAQNPDVLGATGVPTIGFSAARHRNKMRKRGGLHGNLFCMRGTVIKRIADQGIRLPLGLYWVDGLVGALLNFNLDPSCNEWNPERVWVDHQASWTSDFPGIFETGDFASRLRRVLRQARGRIENAAFSEFLHVRRRDPKSLPFSVNILVANWIKESPLKAALSLFLRPWRLYPLRQLLDSRDWSSRSRQAELIIER